MAEQEDDEITAFLKNIDDTLLPYEEKLKDYVDSLENLKTIDDMEIKEMINELEMLKSHGNLFRQGIIELQIETNQVAKLLAKSKLSLAKFFFPLKKHGVHVLDDLRDLKELQLQDLAERVKYESKHMLRSQKKAFVKGVIEWQQGKKTLNEKIEQNTVSSKDDEKEEKEKEKEKHHHAHFKAAKKVAVICIGISKYDSDEYDDLPSVKYDVQNYVDVLKNGYGYETWSSWDAYKGKMKKSNVRSFITKCKRKLTEEDVDEKLVSVFEAIFITLSGHGTSSAIICSDGNRFRYDDIRQRLSDENVLQRIPRIFCVDACRVFGQDDENDKTRGLGGGFGGGALSATLMATWEGRVVSGGKISQFLMRHFSINYDIYVKQGEMKSFQEILAGVSKDLKKEAVNDEQKQKLILSEFDKDVEEFVFVPVDDKERGRNRAANMKMQTSIYNEILNLLVSLQLDVYIEKFQKYSTLNEIKHFGEDELKEMGVNNAKDRNTIRTAIKEKLAKSN